MEMFLLPSIMKQKPSSESLKQKQKLEKQTIIEKENLDVKLMAVAGFLLAERLRLQVLLENLKHILLIMNTILLSAQFVSWNKQNYLTLGPEEKMALYLKVGPQKRL